MRASKQETLMAGPKFSVLIPTRQRARTLRYAIESVLQQQGCDDFEVVVQDNCSSPETADVVRGFTDSRVRYFRTESVLPMHVNWEDGLRHCEGEYLIVLGDDDGLLPDSMVLAAQILAKSNLDVLHWQKHTYWWNDAIREDTRGMLYLNFGHGFSAINRAQTIKGFFAWEVGFGGLPDAYSSFVHRRVIDRVVKESGTYFGPPLPCKPCSPDIYSGIANLAAGDRLASFARGLSIGGNSGASNGTAHVYRKEGVELRDRYYRDEGMATLEALHPALIPSSNIELAVAAVMFVAKERLFHSDPDCQVDLSRTLLAMIANINRDPTGYDETKADIFRFAEKLGVDPKTLTIPPKGVRRPAPLQGPIHGPSGACLGLAVNCREAGINDVAGAARLAYGLLPKLKVD
jgi:glycosyltransferase involved in cell wall biosynthesis